MKCIHTLDDMQLSTKVAWLCGDMVGGRRTYSLARGRNCSCLGRGVGTENSHMLPYIKIFYIYFFYNKKDFKNWVLY